MKISKSELIQVIQEELEAVLTEESADEREDHNIDSLWRYARQNRRALNKLLKEAGHDELEGERPDTDEAAGGVFGLPGSYDTGDSAADRMRRFSKSADTPGSGSPRQWSNITRGSSHRERSQGMGDTASYKQSAQKGLKHGDITGNRNRR